MSAHNHEHETPDESSQDEASSLVETIAEIEAAIVEVEALVKDGSRTINQHNRDSHRLEDLHKILLMKQAELAGDAVIPEADLPNQASFKSKILRRLHIVDQPKD